MIGEPLHLVAGFGAGLGLGVLYLASLWLTVQRFSRMKHSALWLLGTASLRIGLLLMAWYWVADGRWEMLLACLVGFLVARFAATRWAATGDAKRRFES